MRRAAALIVGGGPAGATAAILLARAGVKPLLVERERETGDALCGGFLSWHTLAALDRLGLDRGALGGVPIDRVRLFAGRHRAEALLPAAAVGLSRHALDSALLALAARSGAGVERGVAVREAEAEAERHVRLEDGGTIRADALLLATGKHDLRGLHRPREAAGDDPALGLRLHLAAGPGLSGAIRGVIELHLFDRGYAGLLLQQDGRANLCMAVRKSRLAEAGGKPDALLAAIAAEAPALAERLAAAQALPGFDAVGAVPYGWRAHDTAPGLFRLGDQAGVIASLAGEGVGIAIASGTRAAHMLIAGGPDAAQAYQRALARRLRGPVRTAEGLRAIGERPAVAPLLAAAMRAAPGLARLLARATRIGA